MRGWPGRLQAGGRLDHEATRKQHEIHEGLPGGQAFVFFHVAVQVLLALIRGRRFFRPPFYSLEASVASCCRPASKTEPFHLGATNIVHLSLLRI